MSDLDLAIRGLRVLSTVPLVIIDGSKNIEYGSKSTLTFKFVDYLGNPLKGIKSVKASLVSP